MHSVKSRHTASLQHLLNEIVEEERRYLGHVDPNRVIPAQQLSSNDNGRTRRHGRQLRMMLQEYRQVNREHEITVDTCHHTARQLESGVYSEREISFLIERYRAVLTRVRRDHTWLDRLTRQMIEASDDTSPR